MGRMGIWNCSFFVLGKGDCLGIVWLLESLNEREMEMEMQCVNKG